MTHLDPSLYLDLVGAPYEDGARGPHAYDCVGLAIEIQRRRGIVVPEFISSEAELHRQLASGGIFDGCTRLDAAEPGCIALVRMGIYKHHLGTLIDRFRMLHTTEQTGGAVIERILGRLWQHRILGFYRVGA